MADIGIPERRERVVPIHQPIIAPEGPRRSEPVPDAPPVREPVRETPVPERVPERVPG